MYTYKVRLMFDKTGPCIFFTCIRNNFIYISSFHYPSNVPTCPCCCKPCSQSFNLVLVAMIIESINPAAQYSPSTTDVMLECIYYTRSVPNN